MRKEQDTKVVRRITLEIGKTVICDACGAGRVAMMNL